MMTRSVIRRGEMHSSKPIATLIIAVATAAAVSAYFEGVMEPRCKGQVIKQTKRMQTCMLECIQEFTALHQNKMAGEKKRGATCIHYCSFKRFGFFNATGSYQEKKLNDTITAMLPMVHAKTFKEGAAMCANENNITLTVEDETDYTCMGYKDFFKCFGDLYIRTCTTTDPAIWNED